MKKLKNILLSFILIAICFTLFGFNNQTDFSEVSNAAPTNIANINALNYITLINNGVIKDSSNSTIVDETTRSVMINGPVTIYLNPFVTRYANFSEDNDEYFTKNYVNYKVRISRKEEEMTFEYNGLTFYCRQARTSTLEPTNYYIFYSNTVEGTSYSVSTFENILFDYYEEDNYLFIKILDSFTLKSNNELNVDFKFSVTIGGSSRELTLKLLKPIVEFANAKTPFLKFETYKDFNSETNSYDYYEVDSLIQSEQVFNKIVLTFLNDEYMYTETNPLYFNINFNGFLYNFKFYTKVVKVEIDETEENQNSESNDPIEEAPGELCLFVEYVDNVANQTIELATEYTQLLDYDDNPYISFIEKVLPNEQFSLTFKYRGRYALEFYDNTYLENYKNPNYYSTSFYIKNDTISESDTESRFNDIYILAQSIDDNRNPIEYIVNKSTQNNSVLVLIKNMFLGENENILLEDVIDRIDFTVTEFGNTGGNHPITTSYYPTTDENKFDTSIHKLYEILSLNSDGDYYLYCENDAIYSFEIYAKNPSYDEYGDEYFAKSTYQFTIVKNIKVSFKPDVEDDSIDSTHVASRPYYTETISYTNKIQNSDPIRFEVAYNNRIPVDAEGHSKSTKVLDITYQNNYVIRYGVQSVNISHFINEDNTAITFSFLGVGNMTVYITRGNENLVYTFNSERGYNAITFTEYANYTITLVDSMGTTPSEAYTINFAKKLNTSALILIILSSIIVAAIAAFIIIVRGRIKTR